MAEDKNKSLGTFRTEEPSGDPDMVVVGRGMVATAVAKVEDEKEKEKQKQKNWDNLTFSRWFDTQDPDDCEDYSELMRAVHGFNPDQSVMLRAIQGKTETWDCETQRRKLFVVWSVLVEVPVGLRGAHTRTELIDKYLEQKEDLPPGWFSRSVRT